MSTLIALLLLAHFHILGPLIVLGLGVCVVAAVVWLCAAIIVLPIMSLSSLWHWLNNSTPRQVAQRAASQKAAWQDARNRLNVIARVRDHYPVNADLKSTLDELVAVGRIEDWKLNNGIHFGYRVIDTPENAELELADRNVAVYI